MNPNESQKPPLSIAQLSEDDLRSLAGFSCGDDSWDRDLNEFLRDDALGQQTERLNTTYVFYAGHAQSSPPVAFVALAASEVRKKDSQGLRALLRRTPYSSSPALLIARLAVDERGQGKGFGDEIMGWIRNTALSLPVGCRFLALHVDQENEGAIRFYRRHKFLEPPDVDVGPGMQLMLYDLIRSEEADGRTSDPA